MAKLIVSGLVAGITLLMLSVLGLYATIWLFPGVAKQYYNPAFNTAPGRYLLYFVHPFVISLALSWFWSRFKGILSGSFITRGIEFGLIYAAIATLPMILLIYSAITVSAAMAATWLAFGVLQGLVAGLVFEKTNP